ncbi:DNA topoisomerase, partial [Staphylococcus epidermidis]|uniref:DNA topoisomerase n=1 Tax=Staphylococcus epidermidis TaxID=1282 RepID=UPI0021B26687
PTHSTPVSTSAKSQAQQYMNQKCPQHYLSHPKSSPKHRHQHPHQPITPTTTIPTPHHMKPFLTTHQHPLYKLISQTFLPSHIPPAIFHTLPLHVTQNHIKFTPNPQTIKFKPFI